MTIRHSPSFGRTLYTLSLRLRSHPPIPTVAASRLCLTYFNTPSARQIVTGSAGGGADLLGGTAASRPTWHEPHGSQRLHRQIRTLDPAKLTAEDHLDFSSRTHPNLHIIQPPADDATIQSGTRLWATGSWSNGGFPPNTRGFLYYHVPPGSPPIAGELRFRLTPSSDSTAFAKGSDLLTENGLLWSIPLHRMGYINTFQGFLSLLLHDGLVSERTLDLIRPGTHASGWAAESHPMTPTLSAFGQEFRYNFRDMQCIFVGTDSVQRKFLQNLTAVAISMLDGKVVYFEPLQGSIICCFERSTLPEHRGRRVVVIRVKRLLDSDPVRPVPSPDGRIYPVDELRAREGELLRAMYHRKVRVWAVDVDEPHRAKGSMGRVLGVLFENEELYGSPPGQGG